MEVTVRAATIKIWVTKIVYSEEREQIEHLKDPRKGDAVKTKWWQYFNEGVICDIGHRMFRLKKKNAENNPLITTHLFYKISSRLNTDCKLNFVHLMLA